jgi:hypothetical protein
MPLFCAERVVKHPFPGIELEGEFDWSVVEIDEVAVFAQSDVFDVDQRGLQSGLARGVLEIGQRAGILFILGHAGEMKMPGVGEFLPGVDQAFMDRIELVGALRDDVALDRLFEPGPLKDRGFENRGRGVGVILQQFRRIAAVEAEIQPAVEAGIVAVPAFGNQRPECFGYSQAAQIMFVVDRMADQFETHRVDFGGGLLDSAFDLIQRERVVGPFVPIAFAIDGVKVESGALGGRAPVIAFGAADALHGAL